MAKAIRGGSPAGPGSQVTVSGPRRTRRPWRRRSSKVDRSRMRQMTDTAGAPDSGGELVTALPAAGLDDRPTRPGRHPVAEPVVLGPLAVVGLESALHAVPPRRWTSAPGRRLAAGPMRQPAVRRARRWPGPVPAPDARLRRRRPDHQHREPGGRPTLTERIREVPLALPPLSGATFRDTFFRVEHSRGTKRHASRRAEGTGLAPYPHGPLFSTGVDGVVDQVAIRKDRVRG
jgi:hypothetical protein